MSKDNSDILNKLEKEFNVSEQDGAEIHWNLATIVQKLLKDKPEEDKLNEIKKRYLRPKNWKQGQSSNLEQSFRESTNLRSQTPEGAKIPH